MRIQGYVLRLIQKNYIKIWLRRRLTGSMSFLSGRRSIRRRSLSGCIRSRRNPLRSAGRRRSGATIRVRAAPVKSIKSAAENNREEPQDAIISLLNEIRCYTLVFDTLRIRQELQSLINTGTVALYAVCMKYSNVLSSLTFFLNSFHFPFCYKLIVRPESTCLMKVIRYLLALIYRHKSLFFYICKFYVS